MAIEETIRPTQSPDPPSGSDHQRPADDSTPETNSEILDAAEPRASVADRAERLASLGYRVFVCGPREKHAKVFGGGWQDEATDDPSRARRVFEYKQGRFKEEVNVGIATGEGLLVLDVDVKDKDGEATLRGFEAKHGSLPDTTQVRTGSGGRQLYFSYHGPTLKNAVGFAPGLDLRTDGGLVIAPPSIHPNGNRYEFITESVPLKSLPPAPGWLIEEINRGQAAKREAKKSADGAPVDHSQDESRNATLCSELGKLKRNGWDRETLLSQLRNLNQLWYAGHKGGPLPDGELIAMLDQSAGWDAGSSKPRRADYGKVWSSAELLALNLPQLEWLVDGIVPAGGGAVMLVDRPKKGKSWFATQMAVDVAGCQKFLGKFETKQGRVLYYALEDSHRRIIDRSKRFTEYVKNNLVKDAEIVFANLDFCFDLKLDADGLLRLRDLLKTAREEGRPYALVVIDTFYAAALQSRSSKDPVRADYAEMQNIKDLSYEAGATFLLVHHTRKAIPMEGGASALDAVLGTTGVTAALDAILLLKTDKDGTRIFDATGKDVSLSRELALKFDGAAAPPWTLIGNYVAATSEQRDAMAAVLESPGKTSDIAERIDKTKDATQKLLHKLVREGLVSQDKAGLWFPTELLQF